MTKRGGGGCLLECGSLLGRALFKEILLSNYDSFNFLLIEDDILDAWNLILYLLHVFPACCLFLITMIKFKFAAISGDGYQ